MGKTENRTIDVPGGEDGRGKNKYRIWKRALQREKMGK
jgi:hypothetical protein